MATSLQKIITELRTVALANGFASVQEAKFNMKANADTELPKLYIKMEEFTYDKFQQNAAIETYPLELVAIIADSENPIIDLKTLLDNFLNVLFNQNELFTKLAQGSKIKLIKCDVSNDKELFSKYGGEYASLKMQITNTNLFGGSSCL